MIRRSTAIILGIFLVLMVFAFFFQRDQAGREAPATPDPTPQQLLDRPGEGIDTLLIADRDGQTAELIRLTDAWRMRGSSSSQTDQGQANSIVTQLGSLNVLRSLETGPDLAAIGLDPPAYTVTVAWEDESRQVFSVGDLTPTQDGYFVQLQGGIPLVVNRFGMDIILDVLRAPPILPTPTPIVQETPSPTP